MTGPSLATAVAMAVLWLTCAYLFGLGVAALARPPLAARFLGAFAQSRRANWVEAVVRAVVGAAFVAASPLLAFPVAMAAFGWFLIVTAIAMPLFPDQHRRLARRSVAAVVPIIRLVGLGALAAAGGLALLLWQA